ncbi:MAG: hypothetical protein ACPHY7_00330 [Gammaproteobacteria bacterium]
MTGKFLAQILAKFNKSPVAQNARIQVALPNGKFYDIQGIRLMENKIVGAMETHRLVIVPSVEMAEMAEATKMLHQMDVNQPGFMPKKRKKLILP